MSPAATGASASPIRVMGSVPELWQAVAGAVAGPVAGWWPGLVASPQAGPVASSEAGPVAGGRRFAGLMATQRPEGVLLSAHLAGPGGILTCEAAVPPGDGSYPALTPLVGAASWYEREIHDLFGVAPAGHPRLEPLILPLGGEGGGEGDGEVRPRPGRPGPPPAGIWPDEHSLPRHVMGAGLFTIPHGPVGGVLESVEYLVETPGEDIPAPEPAGVRQAPWGREKVRGLARGGRRAAGRAD